MGALLRLMVSDERHCFVTLPVSLSLAQLYPYGESDIFHFCRVLRAEVNSDQKPRVQVVFFGWRGDTHRSSCGADASLLNFIFVPSLLAKCLGLVEGCTLSISGVPTPDVILGIRPFVSVKTCSHDDWEVVEEESVFVEEHLLEQVSILMPKQKFPVFIRNETPVFFVVEGQDNGLKNSANSITGAPQFLVLTRSTELAIETRQSKPLLGSKSAVPCLRLLVVAHTLGAIGMASSDSTCCFEAKVNPQEVGRLLAGSPQQLQRSRRPLLAWVVPNRPVAKDKLYNVGLIWLIPNHTAAKNTIALPRNFSWARDITVGLPVWVLPCQRAPILVPCLQLTPFVHGQRNCSQFTSEIVVNAFTEFVHTQEVRFASYGLSGIPLIDGAIVSLSIGNPDQQWTDEPALELEDEGDLYEDDIVASSAGVVVKTTAPLTDSAAVTSVPQHHLQIMTHNKVEERIKHKPNNTSSRTLVEELDDLIINGQEENYTDGIKESSTTVQQVSPGKYYTSEIVDFVLTFRADAKMGVAEGANGNDESQNGEATTLPLPADNESYPSLIRRCINLSASSRLKSDRPSGNSRFCMSFAECSDGYFLPHFFLIKENTIREGWTKVVLCKDSLPVAPKVRLCMADMLGFSSDSAKAIQLPTDSFSRIVLSCLQDRSIFRVFTATDKAPSTTGIDTMVYQCQAYESTISAITRLRADDRRTDSTKNIYCKSCLVCGPSGSGKTTLMHEFLGMLSQSTGSIGIHVDCNKLGSAGEWMTCQILERILSIVLNDASEKSQTGCTVAIVFDSLDLLFRTVNDANASHAVLNERSETLSVVVASWLDFLRSLKQGPLCSRLQFIGVCRQPNNLSSALRKSDLFETTCTIPPLGSSSRRHILSCLLSSTCNQSGGCLRGYLDFLVERTEGFSLMDLIGLVRRASSAAVDQLETILLDSLPFRLGLNNGSSTQRLSNAKLQDVGGMHEAKKKLADLLSLPRDFPLLFENAPFALRQGGILVGPPGTGKTMLAEAAITSYKMKTICVKGPELLSKYIGGSEAAVRTVFEKAAAMAPSVVLFDEIEAIAPRRGLETTGVTDRVVNQLLCYLDGVEERRGIAVLATSSRPDLIDPALLRPGRLDTTIYCGIPTREELLEIFQAHCKYLPLAEDVDLPALVNNCLADNTSGADVKAVVSTAQIKSLYDVFGDSNNSNEHSQSMLICQTHLVDATQETPPSLSLQSISWFNKCCEGLVDLAIGEVKTSELSSREHNVKRLALA